MDELKLLEAILTSPPVVGVLIALAAAVSFLFRLLLKRTDESQKRLSELETEFRAYIANQGAQTAALLERAVKILDEMSTRFKG